MIITVYTDTTMNDYDVQRHMEILNQQSNTKQYNITSEEIAFAVLLEDRNTH
jgi:hypothetical protein